MAAGRLCKADPQVVAGAYVSPLFLYAFGEIMGRKVQKGPEAYVNEHVHLLWRGIAPEGRRK
jgi:hypothetical protein